MHSLLRDQRVIAGIGRSWVDEILWEVKLSPFQRGADLDDDAVAAPARSDDGVPGARSTTTRR